MNIFYNILSIFCCPCTALLWSWNKYCPPEFEETLKYQRKQTVTQNAEEIPPPVFASSHLAPNIARERPTRRSAVMSLVWDHSTDLLCPLRPEPLLDLDYFIEEEFYDEIGSDPNDAKTY